MSITLIEQVIWKEYNEINAKKLMGIIDDLENIEICYSENPVNPFPSNTPKLLIKYRKYQIRALIVKKKLKLVSNNKIWLLLAED